MGPKKETKKKSTATAVDQPAASSTSAAKKSTKRRSESASLAINNEKFSPLERSTKRTATTTKKDYKIGKVKSQTKGKKAGDKKVASKPTKKSKKN
uniref:H15 domain-containing protein n=1 Tax=Caenorhabditis tropicalis TaxID=1561998 RepID=A0A1I7UA56_9PELO